MKRWLVIALLTGAAFAQRTSSNILPATTGQTLGNYDYRWTVWAYDVDVQGQLTCNGVPCIAGDVVTVTGDQSIAGVKTFTDGIAVTNENASASLVSVDATTDAGSSAFSTGSFGITVTNPDVFGYNGLFSSCINAVPGAICYAGSTMAIDATASAEYAHTVALNPQVRQTQSKSPSDSSSDYYGVAIGVQLSPGVWPGSGVRVEGPVGAGTAGQIAVAHDMTDGISPTALYARPGCRGVTCNSADIVMQARSAGTLIDPAKLFEDLLGNFRLRTPADVIIDAVNGVDATSSANVNSSGLDFTANGWTGTNSASYTWRIFHNVNSSGVIDASHLEIQPPDNLPIGVNPIVNITAQVDVSGHGIANAGAISGVTSITGTGIQHQRVASCTTTGAQWAGCAVAGAVTWDDEFPDTNYTANCTLQSPNAPGFVTYIADKQTRYIAVQIMAATAVATSGTLDCIAIHD